MTFPPQLRVLLCGLGLVLALAGEAPADATISLVPAQAQLEGAEARQRLIVTGNVDGRTVDLTQEATYESLAPEVVRVSEEGVVSVVGDGSATVVARAEGAEARATFEVSHAASPRAITFEMDVVPILTAAGCNSGPCHGKARGQGGFKLSLLGFYPSFDFAAIAQEARGRRVFPGAPEESLLLQKPTGRVPHGGGRRLEPGGAHYEVLRRWIATGMPRRAEEDPTLTRISVDPTERKMRKGTEQQLLVTACYSDGTTRDVTDTAAFESSESAIVAVDEHGLVTAGMIPGEAGIMARYMGQVANCSVVIPLEGEKPPHDFYAGLRRNNFIDGHVWDKLEQLGLTPSAPAPDHVFLRRAFTDIIGRLPTPEEARRFLEDDSSDKRAKLVDYLLEQPEYADFWANKWSDLLVPNPYRVGAKAVINYDAWIRRAFRENMPYDRFVEELLTAEGSTWHNGAVTLFRDRRSPEERATIVSRLFLGIRLECAKCHHHPFENWGQEHFYGFAAYFARLGRKGQGLSPPISGGEETFYTQDKGSVQHPITGQEMEPTPLFGEAPATDGDPREALVAWMRSDDNPFFVEVMANRVWADLMGRGIVDPIDDFRASNPPANGPLLEALGEHFRDVDYDIKQLIRTIATSYVYGLSSIPNERNSVDGRNYSRHYRTRLRAETLLDAVCDITGVGESFEAMPPGSRATQVWTRRVGSLFLDTFGRPNENEDPPCERASDTSVVQALHLMNSPNLHRKVTSDEGRAAALAASERSGREIVEELYLLVYSRFPTEDELAVGLEHIEKNADNRRQATEDLLWALLNTPEFVFQN